MANESYSRKRSMEEMNGSSNYKRANTGSGKPTLKFLVPNFMAGKLIGKGGSNIGELQSKYAASIQISANKEFYPGTADRVVSVSADIDQLTDFSSYIIDLVEEELQSERHNPDLKQEVKLVVSDIAAGLIIGKGGERIKEILSNNIGTRINISKKDEGVNNERIVFVSGDGPCRTGACKEIIEVMGAAPDKMSNNNLKYSTISNPIQLPQHTLPVYNQLQNDNYNFLLPSVPANSNYQAKSGVQVKFQAEMQIPDKLVGTILGRQGQTIIEYSRNSGAKLQFSGKDEFVPDTTDRILTITGGMYQVQNAYMLVDEKLAQVEREFNGAFGR